MGIRRLVKRSFDLILPVSDEVVNVAASVRDPWVKAKAATLAAGSSRRRRGRGAA